MLGLNGPQGSGKSTLAAELSARGDRWAALSVDDVYLTRAEQAALATSIPELAVRGAPGTHDVALGCAVLDALAGPSGRTAVPSYDKAAFGGLGDRRPASEWRDVDLPLELVIFEGWMLGFPPVGTSDPRLARADAFLHAYAPWRTRLAGMIQLRTEDPETIVRWRVEAERALRARGRGGMSEEQAEAYIRRFLPFYEVYPDALEASPPVPGWHRVVWLDAERRVVER